ncbi:ABC transporter permease [Bifidobacterium lemurum]|uniref:ABC transporter permease n=1 Tax=Bifidobacterium lemurum TaxID=1603886 RepID=A0A261FM69_9BIFI|nr:ABC transporter permease [Bifidobacterium lemurum]OZG60282.1 ABC transporter permease [Bifidobacterium lemurum]QOL34166.1 ABC transporter permease [Bifidobacterium lemurum]
MNDAYANVLRWMADPANWQGSTGILSRTGIYLAYCAVTLLATMAIAIPVGLYVGHTGRFRELVVPFTGALRALPTLGLLCVLSLWMGLGLGAPMVSLVLLAIPPVLAGTYSGIASVDRSVVEASRAVGFSEWGILTQVEIPIALPLIVSGIRSAAVQIVATWTVAAYLPIEGLGRYLIDGLAVQDYTQMLAGSLIIIVIELLVDGLFAAAQKLSAVASHVS